MSYAATENDCNQVAAELLVPQSMIRNSTPGPNCDEIARLARRFKVSTLVILPRIHDSGGLDREWFWSVYKMEVNRLRSAMGRSGGNAVNNVNARIGKLLARALVVSTSEGRASYTEAFRLLGVKQLSTFESVVSNVGLVL